TVVIGELDRSDRTSQSQRGASTKASVLVAGSGYLRHEAQQAGIAVVSVLSGYADRCSFLCIGLTNISVATAASQRRGRSIFPSSASAGRWDLERPRWSKRSVFVCAIV